MINPGEEFTNVILQAAVRFTQKVLISRLTGELIPGKSLTNAHGKDARGVLPGRMNLPDISANTLELNLSNVRIVNDPFQDRIICHCT